MMLDGMSLGMLSGHDCGALITLVTFGMGFIFVAFATAGVVRIAKLPYYGPSFARFLIAPSFFQRGRATRRLSRGNESSIELVDRYAYRYGVVRLSL